MGQLRMGQLPKMFVWDLAAGGNGHVDMFGGQNPEKKIVFCKWSIWFTLFHDGFIKFYYVLMSVP